MKNEVLNDAQILTRVKDLLGISGTFQDDLLLSYIDIVKTDMFNAGVSAEVLNSSKAVGNIMRGVIDNWTYGANADYSPMFIKRTVQLRMMSTDKKDESNE